MAPPVVPGPVIAYAHAAFATLRAAGSLADKSESGFVIVIRIR